MADLNPRASAVGIVYSADGWPRISPEWVKALNPSQVIWVENELRSKGFRLTPDFQLEEIT